MVLFDTAVSLIPIGIKYCNAQKWPSPSEGGAQGLCVDPQALLWRLTRIPFNDATLQKKTTLAKQPPITVAPTKANARAESTECSLSVCVRVLSSYFLAVCTTLSLFVYLLMYYRYYLLLLLIVNRSLCCKTPSLRPYTQTNNVKPRVTVVLYLCLSYCFKLSKLRVNSNLTDGRVFLDCLSPVLFVAENRI